MYNNTVIETFMNPKHVGRLENYTVKSFVGSVECGDALELTLKIENDIITEAKYLVFGCPAAVATSDVLVDLILDKNINDIINIKNIDIVNALNGLPDIKIHCSVMGEEALHKAFNIYVGNDLDVSEDEIICKCNKVTRNLVEKSILDEKIYNYRKLVDKLGVGTKCGKCENRIYNILDKAIKAQNNSVKLNT